MSETQFRKRDLLLRRGIILCAAIVVWNVIEGVVAVASGIIANSVALVSFGVDSFIEVASAVVVWVRLHREFSHQTSVGVEALERRSARITGALLLILAIYIVIDSGRRLLGYGDEATVSEIGMILTGVSLLVMPFLGWGKLKTARGLKSRSLRADAIETFACVWLSLTTLIGLALNAAYGWSWADPIAALLILPLVVHEGIEGFQQESKEHE